MSASVYERMVGALSPTELSQLYDAIWDRNRVLGGHLNSTSYDTSPSRKFFIRLVQGLNIEERGALMNAVCDRHRNITEEELELKTMTKPVWEEGHTTKIPAIKAYNQEHCVGWSLAKKVVDFYWETNPYQYIINIEK